MRALAGSALLFGLLAGAWDAISIVLENPHSFGAVRSIASFAGASLAGYGGLGLAAGAVLGLVLRSTSRRAAPGAVSVALALWLFFWAGVRVHVRWFFGEPLLAAPSLVANALLFGGCAAAAALARPLTRRVAAAGESAPGIGAGLALIAIGAIAAGFGPTRPFPPPARETPPAGARDVLLVTLDTTRADHLSSYGYPRGTTPSIDRLARTGACDVLWASAPLTNPSHCAILSGVSPRSTGVLNNGTALPPGVPTVAELLSQQGWTCAAFVSGIPLKAGLSGLSRGFRVYDDAFSPLERVHPMLTSLAIVRVADRLLPGDLLERRAADTVDAAIGWLARPARPRFVWVHLFDPHTPYRAARPLVHRFARESAPWTASGRAMTSWPIADYDAEIRGTDLALGRLLRAFEETSPDGAVVIVADHGEGLLQHGELTHGSLLFEEDLRIPWIVRGAGPTSPGAEARLEGLAPPRASTEASAVLRALARGEALPPAGTGRLVADTFPPEGRGRRTAVCGLLPDGRIGKTMIDWERGERVAFDLAADPGETRPADASGSAWAVLEPPAPDAASAEELDPEVARRLKSLGYVH
ncbi:MAG: sulfatase [bacterium]